jgi:hypothetical protein
MGGGFNFWHPSAPPPPLPVYLAYQAVMFSGLATGLRVKSSAASSAAVVTAALCGRREEWHFNQGRVIIYMHPATSLFVHSANCSAHSRHNCKVSTHGQQLQTHPCRLHIQSAIPKWAESKKLIYTKVNYLGLQHTHASNNALFSVSLRGNLTRPTDECLVWHDMKYSIHWRDVRNT